MPDVKVGGVPFKEALDHFKKNKELLPSKSWDEFINGEQARAFTIAGVTKVDMLNDFKKAIEDIRSRGGTKNDFIKEFDAIAERYGWQYKGDRSWRSKLIFETNVRTSNAAGRWAQIERRQAAIKKRNPSDTLYLEYKVLDNSPTRRPEHQAWEGLILPVDHPLWEEIYPPNGFGCECYVVILTSRALKARGLKVTENPPKLRMTERFNRSSGEIYPPTPEGVDVGFNHNHGRSAYLPDGAGIVDARLGSKLAKVTLDSDDFESFIAGGFEGVAVVGFLPDGIPELIGATTSRVLLSDDLVKKQLKRNTKPAIADYRRLPEGIEEGLMIQDSTDTFVFILVGSKVYRATIKPSKSGEQIHLTDLRASSQKEINQLRESGVVLREPL